MLQKIILCSALILLFCALLCCSGAYEKVTLREGDTAPAFSKIDIDGRSWNSGALRGKTVVINFWSPACPPCRAEMPSLKRLHEKMRALQDFEIVTILYGADPLQAMQFFKTNRYDFPLIIDDDLSIARSFGVTGVPETYIVDKKGVLRKKVLGQMHFDAPDTMKFIHSLRRE